MANVLSKDKQITVIGALAEGSSIRSIERMMGVHTVLHIAPVTSAEEAVRMAIVQEFRSLEPAEEN